MKKFLTTFMALVLALAMTFAMVACEEKDNNPGGNSGGNEQGGNSEDEKLQPVEAKEFFQTIMEQFSDSTTVTLTAETKGTTTAPNAEGVSTDSEINQSIAGEERSLAEAKKYIANVLTVFDDLWSIVGGLDIFGNDMFAGTVPVAADNSGYEYAFAIETEQVQAVLDGVNEFFDTTGQKKIPDILDPVLAQAAGEGTSETTAEWLTRLLDAKNTLGNIVEEITKILPSSFDLNKIVRIITGIMTGVSLDLDTILQIEVVIDENGAITFPTEDTVGAVKLADMEIGTLVETLMNAPGAYAFLMPMIVQILTENEIYKIYDMVVSLVGQQAALPFIPTTEIIKNAQLEKVSLSVLLKTDKNKRLTNFVAEVDFNGNSFVAEKDSWGDPTGKNTVYAADITAFASGTFNYAA